MEKKKKLFFQEGLSTWQVRTQPILQILSQHLNLNQHIQVTECMHVCVLIKTSCQKKSENMRRLDYYTCWSKVKGKEVTGSLVKKKKGPIVEF